MAQRISTGASCMSLTTGFPSPERGEMLQLRCISHTPTVRQGRDERMA